MLVGSSECFPECDEQRRDVGGHQQGEQEVSHGWPPAALLPTNTNHRIAT
jgi:hypothetical protein